MPLAVPPKIVSSAVRAILERRLRYLFPAACQRSPRMASELSGAVLSMLIPVIAATEELPARSKAVPLVPCPAPSAANSTSGGQDFTPDRLSEQVNTALTSLLFQPFALASGDRARLMVGLVRSILKAALFCAPVLPRLSFA
ncbi:MAG TPA: hypothetical protein DCQ25_07745 [Elusimicrobia bacterium]|nr:hypothetical protein [Elusimicrobiota bacterium]